MVSALLIDRHDNLYVSREFRNEKGTIVRLHTDGTRQEIVNNLSKPDGLALFQNGIAIAQEGGKQPVLWWRDGETRLLFSGDSIEGLASDGRCCRRRKSVEIWRHKTVAEFGVERLTNKGPVVPLVLDTACEALRKADRSLVDRCA